MRVVGIVLDLQNKKWYFFESQRHYSFVRAGPDISVLLAVHTESQPCHLRKNEGIHLSPPQRERINSLIEMYEKCLQPGKEPTHFIERRINTEDHLSVVVPSYWISSFKKEVLKQDIDKLLADGGIEEYESPYAFPVVLIPKPNETMRICIDYQKLNSITDADSYLLPLMDDLLHEAKTTPFMSIIDLWARHYQVKCYPDDQDKNAFPCPF